MAYEFRLPDLGEGLTEAEIARWLVDGGRRGRTRIEPLVEVQTDKTTVEIPSPRAGTVLKILVEEGDVARVGAVIVVIGEAGEQLLRAVDGGKQAEPASEPIVAVVPADPSRGRARDAGRPATREGARRRAGRSRRERAGRADRGGRRSRRGVGDRDGDRTGAAFRSGASAARSSSR